MKQILTRLALTIPVVWLVVSLVFLLIHLVPGDPIQQMHEGLISTLTKPGLTNSNPQRLRRLFVNEIFVHEHGD